MELCEEHEHVCVKSLFSERLEDGKYVPRLHRSLTRLFSHPRCFPLRSAGDDAVAMYCNSKKRVKAKTDLEFL